MTTAALVEKVADADSVRRWRLQALLRAGYTPADALVLSGEEAIDLHQAVDLVRRGCPPRTAARILL